MTFDSVKSDIKSGNLKPFYLLHGEEPYFVDQLTDMFAKDVVPAEALDFDLSIIYGQDVKADQVISTAKRFPMISKLHLVILKEAQSMRSIADILPLIENPVPSTVLVIASKSKVDQRKKWVKAIKKKGEIFNSAKINDWDMSKWIASQCRSKGYSLDMKSSVMLYEFLGNDLSRIIAEIDKLGILLKDDKKITPELIEKNIGISRDYNNFELQDALLKRNVLKVNTIVKYYGENSKDHPMPMITASLYSFFTKLVLIHAHKAFNPQVASNVLKVKPFYAGKLLVGANNYSYAKLIKNISILTSYDLKSKGVGSFDEDPAELLREMFYKLIH